MALAGALAPSSSRTADVGGYLGEPNLPTPHPFAGYESVGGDPPRRRRTTANPLDLEDYLAWLAGRRANDRRAFE